MQPVAAPREPARWMVLVGGVLGVVVLAVVTAAAGAWRVGLIMLGAALLAAAALRLLVPGPRLATLVVRTRTIDALVLGVLGVLLVAVTASL